MGSRYDKKRINMEGDRLSNLPDDLIHKILSFMEIKQAIKTSGLSSRWRYIWTSMPSLNLSNMDFDTLAKFSKFVTHVLSRRNNQIEVSSVKLTFGEKVSQPLVKRILKYASSHNVQQLNITTLPRKIIEFPLSIFSSQSLKHLTLAGHTFRLLIPTQFTWELPALATLNLHHVQLYDDTCGGLISSCANLKILILKDCRVPRDLNGINISHNGLLNVTLEDGFQRVNVVTPQLKNLTIKSWQGIHLVSAPNLSTLVYEDRYHSYYRYRSYYDNDVGPLQLPIDLLHLEKVDICIDSLYVNKAYTDKIVGLFQQLRCVKFLTLNLELVKLLSSSVELISHQPSSFTNLKTLKIYPANVANPKVTMSNEAKNYLLDGSPDATLTMVSHEEIRAVMKVTSSRKLMGELQVLLDKWKASSVTNTAYMKQEKAPTERHMAQQDKKMKRDFRERMEYIESYWEVMNKQFVKGYNNTRRTISMLRKIEQVLKKVPRSDRAMLQTRFSGLRAEAETMMDSVMDRVKIQCD